MKKTVNILDCTLRDGGYVLDWDFGELTIISIVAGLEKSSIDYIECGYLKENVSDISKTFFASIEDLRYSLHPHKKYTFMINCGEYSISNFKKCLNKNIKIRFAFKKNQYKEALEYITELQLFGWDIFVNPMNTNMYSNKELENLVCEINQINPYGFFIVDTFGSMSPNSTSQLTELLDKSLNPAMILGLHTHNSMNLAHQNAVAFLDTVNKREVIIDSCLYGMGRGAGNLQTELFVEYMNRNYDTNYDADCLQKCIQNNLSEIYQKYHWGYSKIYHIAAQRQCHPNYAIYLVKNNVSEVDAEKIINQIPWDKKMYYDERIIKDIIN